MLLSLVWSCHPDNPTPGTVEDVAVTASEVVPSVFEVSWTVPGARTSWIDFGVDSVGEARTPENVGSSVRLVGLEGGRTYRYRPSTRLASGTVVEGPEGTIDVPAPPFEVTLAVDDPRATVTGGWIVAGIFEATGSWVVILDGRGQPVWWYDTGHQGAVPPLLDPVVADGWDGGSQAGSCRYDEADSDVLLELWASKGESDATSLERVPVDVMTADEIVVTRLPFGHHDFALPEAGTVGHLQYRFEDIDGVTWASDAIVELPEGSQSMTPSTDTVWSWLDDFPVDPSVIDPLQEGFPLADFADQEWTHSNSLMVVGDSYFLLSKYLDSLVKIDRRTRRYEWVLGGPYGDFTLPGGDPVWTSPTDTPWSHGHMSHLWYDEASGTGGFAIFDNGFRHPAKVGHGDGWSAAAEYSFDERARTVREVWRHADPDGGFTALIGDVRKLDSGNRLVSWSTLDRIEEIAEDGTVLWQVTMPHHAPARLSYVAALR